MVFSKLKALSNYQEPQESPKKQSGAYNSNQEAKQGS